MQLLEQCSTLNEISNPAGIGFDILNDEATSVIGLEGGVVRVTDAGSPLFGTYLRVPPGALDTPVRISIMSGDHTCSFGLSPSIKLLPNGLHFKRAVTLKVCLNDSYIIAPNELKSTEPALYNYDETNAQWTHDEAVRLDWEGNAVLCDLFHL